MNKIIGWTRVNKIILYKYLFYILTIKIDSLNNIFIYKVAGSEYVATGPHQIPYSRVHRSYNHLHFFWAKFVTIN